MDKIKKRILDAVKNLQLAKNEMDRLRILGKGVGMDADLNNVLDMAHKLINEIKNV